MDSFNLIYQSHGIDINNQLNHLLLKRPNKLLKRHSHIFIITVTTISLSMTPHSIQHKQVITPPLKRQLLSYVNKLKPMLNCLVWVFEE